MTAPVLCACGCGEPTRPAKRTNAAYGHVRGVPTRFLPGHNAKLRPNRIDRYVVLANGCWEWTGRINWAGYGTARSSDRRTTTAHRAVWEKHHGPLARELHLDHLCHTRDLDCRDGGDCRHRRCVNPAHLEPVTPLENRARARTRYRLTTDELALIKASTLSTSALSRQIGTSRQTIANARNGLYDAHLDVPA